jgi:hypothetical protein
MESLPFRRTIATGFYDGPTQGFTECSKCKRAYSFRKLDWDDLQDVRITGFGPLQIDLDAIVARLKIKESGDERLPLVPVLSGPLDRFVEELLSHHPWYVAALREGWPGRSSVWRDIRTLDLESVSDWFSFLGVPRGNRQEMS